MLHIFQRPDRAHGKKQLEYSRPCISLAETKRSETKDLVDWMISINLDLKNSKALDTVNPKDMMVRCSLDFGVHVIIAIIGLDVNFFKNKRALSMGLSENDEKWLSSHRYIPPERSLAVYAAILRLYGFDPPGATTLAATLSQVERGLDSFIWNENPSHSTVVVGSIWGMGRKTEPHITGDEWASAFARNTQHNYNGDNVILYTESLLAIVARLVGTVNTRWMTTLIAWSLFRQLSVYTDVRLLLATAKAN
ncbi:hypothetical protein MRX96_054880, partial [Rhipicephalus microplus]